MQRIFITGTDTGCGKTRVSCLLIRGFQALGHRVAGFKPVASGCEATSDGLRNEDALALIDAADISLPYEQVNPWALQPPIAPHIAAAEAGMQIEPEAMAAIIRQSGADVAIIEAVGGWCVPLGDNLMLADLARAISDDLLLVVGIRLGCLNHALMTVRQIEQDGFKLSGWIANRLDPDMLMAAANINTLVTRIEAPLLGTVPFLDESKHQKVRLSLDSLLD